VVPKPDSGPECGKDGTTDQCGLGVWTVACPSSKLCVAGDSYGNTTASTDPVDAATWKLAGPQVNEFDGISCSSRLLCIGICPTGFGGGDGNCPGGSYGAGTVIIWNPLRYQPANFYGGTSGSSSISPNPLTGIWCMKTGACFASDGTTGDLYQSTHPGKSRVAWQIVLRSRPGITGIACPTRKACVAVDAAGDTLTSVLKEER
jgi:hypothetical protein